MVPFIYIRWISCPNLIPMTIRMFCDDVSDAQTQPVQHLVRIPCKHGTGNSTPRWGRWGKMSMIKPGDGMEMSVVSDIFRARMSQISPFFSHHFLDPIPNIHEDGLFIMKTASESCQHTTPLLPASISVEIVFMSPGWDPTSLVFGFVKNNGVAFAGLLCLNSGIHNLPFFRASSKHVAGSISSGVCFDSHLGLFQRYHI